MKKNGTSYVSSSSVQNNVPVQKIGSKLSKPGMIIIPAVYTPEERLEALINGVTLPDVQEVSIADFCRDTRIQFPYWK
jgi:hypothetical protein